MGFFEYISQGIYAFFSRKPEPEKNLEYFINAFLNYSITRKREAESARPKRPLNKHYHFCSIKGRLLELNAALKCGAAKKMMRALQGHSVEFTDDDFRALREPGDNLTRLVNQCGEAGLLPDEFIRQEREKKEREFLAKLK